MPGYVCLVSRVHAVELHDLDESQVALFVLDMRDVSRAVSTVTAAVKMNYEIHGNTLPHLHVHFFPRYVGDQFEGAPVDPRRSVQPIYGSDDYLELRNRILSALPA